MHLLDVYDARSATVEDDGIPVQTAYSLNQQIARERDAITTHLDPDTRFAVSEVALRHEDRRSATGPECLTSANNSMRHAVTLRDQRCVALTSDLIFVLVCGQDDKIPALAIPSHP